MDVCAGSYNDILHEHYTVFIGSQNLFSGFFFSVLGTLRCNPHITSSRSSAKEI